MNKLSLTELISLHEPLEPETISRFYPELSDVEVQKVLVMKVIRDTSMVFEDFDVFENAVHVLNSISPDVTKTEGCLPEHIWYAIQLIEQIAKKEFSYEVKEYIKWCHIDQGYKVFPPSVFSAEENPLYDTVKQMAEEGPFPLQETTVGIQAVKYLKIQEYIKRICG